MMFQERKIIIIGAGDLGREIFYSALMQDRSRGNYSWIPMAFIDEDINKIGRCLEGVQIVSFEQASEFVDKNVYFILGVGFPGPRVMLIKKLLSIIPNAQFAIVIHSSAVIMPNTKIEPGVYIGPHATISTGCHIKAHTVLNFNVSVGHDCVFNDYCVICPGCLLSGRTEIGEQTFLGSGAITYPGVKIGKNCIISANICVRSDVNDRHRVLTELKSITLPLETECHL